MTVHTHAPVTAPSGSALDVVDLVKIYRSGGRKKQEVRALDGASFSVPAGTIFGLLGPNGAGKSTTVKILTTLSRADSGSARVMGLDVVKDQARVRLAIGYVSQKSGTDPDATGHENLVLTGRIYGLPRQAAQRRADELLARFDLTEAGGRLVRTYSGGMQRKLDVALGLVHRPQVLFLDEPTTGLDPEARAGMWDEIARLSDQDGITVLLTTHYLEEADRLASRLAIVDRGRIVAEGTPETLKAELRGDAVQIDLVDAANQGHARLLIERLPGVGDIHVEGATLRARVDSGSAAVPAVLSALDDDDIAVASVTMSRPSLDDVYLRHAGRSFQTADRAENGRAA